MPPLGAREPAGAGAGAGAAPGDGGPPAAATAAYSSCATRARLSSSPAPPRPSAARAPRPGRASARLAGCAGVVRAGGGGEELRRARGQPWAHGRDGVVPREGVELCRGVRVRQPHELRRLERGPARRAFEDLQRRSSSG